MQNCNASSRSACPSPPSPPPSPPRLPGGSGLVQAGPWLRAVPCSSISSALQRDIEAKFSKTFQFCSFQVSHLPSSYTSEEPTPLRRGHISRSFHFRSSPCGGLCSQAVLWELRHCTVTHTHMEPRHFLLGSSDTDHGDAGCSRHHTARRQLPMSEEPSSQVRAFRNAPALVLGA